MGKTVFHLLFFYKPAIPQSIHFLVRPRLGEVRVTRLNSSQDGISAGIAELVYAENNNTINKTWTRICSVDNNNKYNSDTVCAQLGYSWASSYYSVYVNHVYIFTCRLSWQPICNCTNKHTYIYNHFLIFFLVLPIHRFLTWQYFVVDRNLIFYGVKETTHIWLVKNHLLYNAEVNEHSTCIFNQTHRRADNC